MLPRFKVMFYNISNLWMTGFCQVKITEDVLEQFGIQSNEASQFC